MGLFWSTDRSILSSEKFPFAAGPGQPQALSPDLRKRRSHNSNLRCFFFNWLRVRVGERGAQTQHASFGSYLIAFTALKLSRYGDLTREWQVHPWGSRSARACELRGAGMCLLPPLASLRAPSDAPAPLPSLLCPLLTAPQRSGSGTHLRAAEHLSASCGGLGWVPPPFPHL